MQLLQVQAGEEQGSQDEAAVVVLVEPLVATVDIRWAVADCKLLQRDKIVNKPFDHLNPVLGRYVS